MSLSNLAVDSFLILREAFFQEDGSSKKFLLRDKKNTQDDPLDEYIAQILSENLENASCEKSTEPLIYPDMVIFRKDECTKTPRKSLEGDSSLILGLEVKKIERHTNGKVRRSTRAIARYLVSVVLDKRELCRSGK